MKKVSIITALVMLVSAAAFAAVPVIDGEKGDGAVGYSWHRFDVDYGVPANEKFNGHEFYGTYLLGKNWGVNVDYFSYNGKYGNINADNTYGSIGLQYRLAKGVAAEVGYLRTTAEGDSNKYTRNTAYAGLSGVTNLGKNVNAYASVKAGSKVTDWTVGMTYEFKKDWMLDVNYRNLKTSYNVNGHDHDAKADGIGVGLVYKF